MGKTYTSEQTAILMLMTGLVTVMVTSALIVGLNMPDTRVGACYQNKFEPDMFAKIGQRIELNDVMMLYYGVTSVYSAHREDPNQASFPMNRTEDEFLLRYKKADCAEYDKTLQSAEVSILQHQILELKLRGDRE